MRETILNRKIVNGINGYDLEAIMGVSKNNTIYNVYSEKIAFIKGDIIVKQLSEEEYWKLTFKEMTGREYSIRTNKKVRNENKIIIDEEYNFMIGNIDKRVVGENSILMCKAENIFLNKEWDGEKLPESYILEAQHNMRVCKAEKCIIASIIDGKRFTYKEVIRDNKIIDMIIQIEKDFWENNILRAIPPK